MASKHLFIFIATVALALPHFAFAKDYIVGDDKGWRLGVNYTTWAEGKKFFVGDALIFNYSPQFHNVFDVNGPEFLACSVPSANKPLATGNDRITLTTPGSKWFLCGVANHCSLGQKLVITVRMALPAHAPSPAAAPPTANWAASPLHPSLMVSAALATLISIFN